MINRKKRNIVVFGAGYVGLSVAVFLSEKNNVCIFDIDQEKIAKLLNAESPIEDTEIQKFFEMEKTRSQKQLGICSDIEEKLEDADYVIIATPTNLNHQTGHLGLDTIRQVLKDISRCSKIPVVIIKSTLPIEGCKVLQGEFPSISLFYVPEFSREGSSLLDEKNPERLIIGFSENANRREIMDISKIFVEDHKNVPVRIMNTTEAEAVKLFANTYLAMRIAFFNEIDNFSVSLKLNSEKIIRGICDDSRIGNYYNIPSFGYGGYCLPKDTKELRKSFTNIPERLISASIEANEIRKKFIINEIQKQIEKISKKQRKVIVGVYRLTMKRGSDNFRESAVLDIVHWLKTYKCQTIIFEPKWNKEYYEDIKVEKQIQKFKEESDLIIANRITEDLSDVLEKTYTRDIIQ